MDMLMQLWRLEYERDGINIDNLCLYLPIRMSPVIMRGKSYRSTCRIVCYMAVKHGQ